MRKMFLLIHLFAIGLLITTVNCCKKEDIVTKKEVEISWANPADIKAGTALSAIQLNATANVEGTFVYTPPIGTVLNIGPSQNLKVDFTPTDVVSYNSATKTVTINVTNSALAIGDSYQGGKIAYIFQVGDLGFVQGQTHGLIAADTDLGKSNAWFNGTYTVTGATGIVIGTGNANTSSIIKSQGNTGNYAAKICRDYNGGGFADWHLPSKDELNKLYLNRNAIGGFTSYDYWSSTENSNNFAWYQYFSTGGQVYGNKDNVLYVRAVRTF